MRLGFGLLQTGKNTGPDNVSRVARRAEELGYDSLWVFDRLLYPSSCRLRIPPETDPFQICTEEFWIRWKR
jgi:alkanesulfonate monooxygenase SsuD/methylene tetrahydromethanopterin reductase-like flavin-dependent oxidoreductase (luciferase family)